MYYVIKTKKFQELLDSGDIYFSDLDHPEDAIQEPVMFWPILEEHLTQMFRTGNLLPSRCGERWDRKEIEKAAQLIKDGVSLTKIALLLGRSELEIANVYNERIPRKIDISPDK